MTHNLWAQQINISTQTVQLKFMTVFSSQLSWHGSHPLLPPRRTKPQTLQDNQGEVESFTRNTSKDKYQEKG